MVTHVIKRTGHIEPYLEDKLHDSLTWALHSVRALEGEAALLSARVSRDMLQWLEGKSEVTTLDIRTHASASLAVLHTEAAYAYDAHDQVL
jgi:transcriptional regulator NrdR family protein